jgi:hypothetical protein
MMKNLVAIQVLEKAKSNKRYLHVAQPEQPKKKPDGALGLFTKMAGDTQNGASMLGK